MKIICTFLMLIIATTAFAQYKCNLIKNETDAFTGEKVKETDRVEIDKGDTRTTSLKVMQNGNNYNLYFGMGFFSASTTQNFVVNQGQTLMIKLENNDTIVLHASRKYEGTVKQVVQYGTAQTWQNINNDYPMTKTQLDKLNGSPLKLFRVYVIRPDGQEYGIDGEPHKKLAGVVMEMINCIKSN